MVNFNDSIENRTFDLPALNAMPRTGKGTAEDGSLMSADIDNRIYDIIEYHLV
jgi:hypothetical protein